MLFQKPQISIPFDEFINSIKDSWNGFINNGDRPKKILSSDILSSWERSLEYGVDPFQSCISKSLRDQDLKIEREKNEKMLKYAHPVMKQLQQAIEGSNSVLTISDKNGYVLEMYGDKYTLKEASKINFYPGAPWSEEEAGTNAIGTVLKEKKPIQIVHTEHFCTGWHDWTCVSSPILNPLTNELMGVIDLSGKWKGFPQHTLGMAISMSSIISQRIERKFLDEVNQLNPFLVTAICSIDEGLMAVDLNKNVIKTNEVTNRIFGKKVQNLTGYPYLEILIEKVMHGNEKFFKKEININQKKYIVSIYPVNVDGENIGGVIVRLNESKLKSKQAEKTTNQTIIQKTDYNLEDMIGSSHQFQLAVHRAQKAAKVDSTLLITGETGVGKEVLAQVVHSQSDRSEHPFVAVNCGAIPRNLIESELFGYETGSFTGAHQKGKKGKFELAHNGTIFLDEIGDMPIDVQVHLLRVLEERKIQRIGGDQAIPINVRVIAATNKNLRDAIKNGEFREDLFYRLKVINIEIPSLKERKSDIPQLVHHFIRKLGDQFRNEQIHIEPKVIEVLQEYTWPGNIRELKNVVEQMLFNMEGNMISVSDLPDEIVREKITSEKEDFIQVIQETNGNMGEIAKKLGISRATLYRKMKKFGIKSSHVKNGININHF
ncbi:sigma-54-dependent Fis family transcriptional regulator [Bacillus marasmi]|uniref:sigma-54-dependent Fis family transcriptional regulator n=1 Tax=Bacillus marasmi TaxID=1926279 RepID=UPI001FEC2A56|nr:sigma-54-dependent Fis family transcriptional regulator [Bacillus marasmi]